MDAHEPSEGAKVDLESPQMKTVQEEGPRGAGPLAEPEGDPVVRCPCGCNEVGVF